MRILASSPGWKEKGPNESQSLEPPCSVPMTMGKSSRITPAMPMVNLYSASLSTEGTRARVSIMAATETKSQITWPSARSGASLVTKAMPMPESRKTMGRIAGSAPGANLRVATCARANDAVSPMGTARVVRLSSTDMFMRYMT